MQQAASKTHRAGPNRISFYGLRLELRARAVECRHRFQADPADIGRLLIRLGSRESPTPQHQLREGKSDRYLRFASMAITKTGERPTAEDPGSFGS